ncbi:MAG: 3'-5' exonuclease [Kofleriaceae bacterium]
MVALGPNARQRLAGLRELCFQIEARAREAQLDFDATMERVRGWIDRPQALDRPHPVTGDAVRVMTIHQAKGLEFPVVVLWDGCATWKERPTYDAWTVARDRGGWAMRLDLLRWEEPAGLANESRERVLREAERKRLVYVAATRARDILVIPRIGPHDGSRLWGRLLGATGQSTVVERELHTPQRHADWFDVASPASAALPEEATDRDVDLARSWAQRAVAASRAWMRPLAFTQASSPRLRWGKQGRFGTAFGETVHVAIGLVLQDGMTAEDAVARAAARSSISTHLRDAVDDVARVLAALHDLGLEAGRGRYQLEYPVAGPGPAGALVAGYVDLVVEISGCIVLLDFKTDTPPTPEDPMSHAYIDQVAGYARVLEQGLGIGQIRAGLLYSADGAVRWLSSSGST